MAVDYFLIDAPHVVPAEFSAWEAAKNKRYDFFMLFCDVWESVKYEKESESLHLKNEEDRLKKVALDAWLKKLETARLKKMAS